MARREGVITAAEFPSSTTRICPPLPSPYPLAPYQIFPLPRLIVGLRAKSPEAVLFPFLIPGRWLAITATADLPAAAAFHCCRRASRTLLAAAWHSPVRPNLPQPPIIQLPCTHRCCRTCRSCRSSRCLALTNVADLPATDLPAAARSPLPLAFLQPLVAELPVALRSPTFPLPRTQRSSCYFALTGFPLLRPRRSSRCPTPADLPTAAGHARLSARRREDAYPYLPVAALSGGSPMAAVSAAAQAAAAAGSAPFKAARATFAH